MRLFIVTAEGEIRECTDVLAWAEWYEGNADRSFAVGGRIVEQTKVHSQANGQLLVSTEFNGIGMGIEMLNGTFETIVFGGPHDKHVERYHTLAAAREGHARWLDKVMAPVPIEIVVEVSA